MQHHQKSIAYDSKRNIYIEKFSLFQTGMPTIIEYVNTLELDFAKMFVPNKRVFNFIFNSPNVDSSFKEKSPINIISWRNTYKYNIGSRQDIKC